MYKVIKYFTDLQDNSHAYHVGDSFPHNGMEVSEERLKELSTTKNKRGIPLIEKVEDFPMNPPEEVPEEKTEEVSETKVEEKPKKKRGRPRNAE